jgi:hypothetical protein
MSKPSSHPSSIILDHCWVCQAKFLGSGGTEPKEEHHIIPRAYGGSDGPTVSVCDSHHHKLHDIALKLKSNKPFFEALKGESQEAIKKLLYLANAVYNAELATRNDPNKAASAMLLLNARHKSMIDTLKKIYPQAKSREAILLVALETLHAKHFVAK